jgi:hypothetical protein
MNNKEVCCTLWVCMELMSRYLSKIMFVKVQMSSNGQAAFANENLIKSSSPGNHHHLCENTFTKYVLKELPYLISINITK